MLLIIFLQDFNIKRLDLPLAFFNFELTEFILSLTRGEFGLVLTSNPAFFKIDKSVNPPAEVFLCLEAGSG